MKIPNLNILDENNKILRTISKEVVFPLSSEDENDYSDYRNYYKACRANQRQSLQSNPAFPQYRFWRDERCRAHEADWT